MIICLKIRNTNPQDEDTYVTVMDLEVIPKVGTDVYLTDVNIDSIIEDEPTKVEAVSLVIGADKNTLRPEHWWVVRLEPANLAVGGPPGWMSASSLKDTGVEMLVEPPKTMAPKDLDPRTKLGE